jgi:hypothetical protein
MKGAGTRTVEVGGARSGHGATTLAILLALELGWGVDSWEPSHLRSVTGGQVTRSTDRPLVVDVGSINRFTPLTDYRVAVLRGPDSAGVEALVNLDVCLDALILVSEPWRALSSPDVAASVGRPVDVCLGFSAEIARMADSGVLGPAALTLEVTRDLSDWARRSIGLSPSR